MNTHVFSLDQELINIGRKLDNNIVIQDPRVSRNHAQIRLVKKNYVILDLNSTGGTFVNGKRVTKSMLYSGDTVSFSSVIVQFIQDAPRMITSAMDRTGPLPNLDMEEPPTQSGPIPRPSS